MKSQSRRTSCCFSSRKPTRSTSILSLVFTPQNELIYQSPKVVDGEAQVRLSRRQQRSVGLDSCKLFRGSTLILSHLVLPSSVSGSIPQRQLRSQRSRHYTIMTLYHLANYLSKKTRFFMYMKKMKSGFWSKLTARMA